MLISFGRAAAARSGGEKFWDLGKSLPRQKVLGAKEIELFSVWVWVGDGEEQSGEETLSVLAAVTSRGRGIENRSQNKGKDSLVGIQDTIPRSHYLNVRTP